MDLKKDNNFPGTWDKVVFWGSIAGLVFLAFISFFKYYYVIPEQQDIPKIKSDLEQLKIENHELKSRLKSLQDEN